MNDSQINGGLLNGAPVRGFNALLSGGVAALSVFSALLVSDAVLAGGVANTPTASGRVSSHLSGGACSDGQVSGKWFITTVLRGGALSDGSVAANLGRAPGLQDGVESPSGFGGQLRTHVRLQSADTVGDVSVVAGAVRLGATLAQGASSTSYASGNIIGSTVLMADGIKSNGFLGGRAIYTGRVLSDGVSSTSALSAKLFYPAILQGGFLSTGKVGKELDIEARLQGGVVQVGAVNSPVMRIGSHLVSGIARYSSVSSLIIVSPACNGGVPSDAALQSGLRIGAQMQGGIASGDFTSSVGIVASQKLIGGIDSGAALNAGQRIGALLQVGIGSAHGFGAQQVIAARLQGGNASLATFHSGLRVAAALMGGVQSDSTLSGRLMTHVFLRGGALTSANFGSELRATAVLAGNGFSSSGSLFGDIVQGFDDPLLNTSALEIRSATETLSIVSPLLKDV